MTQRGRSSGDAGRGRAGEAAFRQHLTVYLVFALFFVSLNVLTAFGDWWFYWPLFFWGWAVVIHAVAAFGAEAPAHVAAIFRDLIPWSASKRSRRATAPAPDPRRAGGGGPERGAVTARISIEDAEARIARLWRVARQIPTESVRERAFRVCAAADQVAEVLAQDKADPQLVGWFVERHLAPTEALLERYTRLASRRVAAAEPALARVEEHDLPLLESRLDALYQQLHRGDVIDLAVASEMLELEGFDDRPPAPARRLST
ncbi:MAG: 2TM domain-containing protein [Chloroflexota bacterium]|nr:2TM domain-containing protein [Chloroflexota bacterium]